MRWPFVSKLRYRQRRKFFSIEKTVSLLPNLFTLGNAFLGYLAIVFAAQREFIPAAYFILLAALFDSLDGRIARYFDVESELGLQLDSFADAISFCLAPAFLSYFWQLKKFGVIGFFVTAVFFLAGVVRLARFNLTSDQQTQFFSGLPSTIAGCFIVIILLNQDVFYGVTYFPFLFVFLLLFMAYLMLSSVRFSTFKASCISSNKRLPRVLFLLLFAFITVMRFQISLLILFLFYFSYTFVNHIRCKWLGRA